MALRRLGAPLAPGRLGAAAAARLCSSTARAGGEQRGDLRHAQRKFLGQTYEGANAVLPPSSPDKVSAKRANRVQQPGGPQGVRVKQVAAEMKSLMQKKRFAEALQLFRTVEDPPTGLCNSALSACGKALRYDDACGIWERIAPDQRSVVSYGAMLDVCRRCKVPHRAEELWAEMLERGLEPNVIVVCTMINLHSACGQVDRAAALFESASKTLLPSADPTSKQMLYLALMSAHARAGDYARTREVFMALIEGGTPPTNLHFNALITSCGRTADAATARAIFDMMPSYGLLPRREDFIILASCCKHDLEKFQQVLASYREAGHRMDAIVNEQLLDAYIIAGDRARAQELLATEGALDLQSPRVQRLSTLAQRLP